MRAGWTAWVLALSSSVLLFAAFPPWNLAELGWVALIPWILALRCSPENAGRISYAAGLLFWCSSLWFLTPVTVAGGACLAAYCALFWIPPGLLIASFLKKWKPGESLRALQLVLGGSFAWCAMEGLRGWLLTGFPWNQLGVSQWENYGLMQLASLGGVELISFVLLCLNVGIAMSILSVVETLGQRLPRRWRPELYVPILIMAFSFSWGTKELRRVGLGETKEVRVSVIQPMAANFWTEELANENYRTLWNLSEASLLTNPDLILWPETAIPDELLGARGARPRILIKNLVDQGVPLLMGSLHYEFEDREDGLERIPKYYNASFFIEEGGKITGSYFKRHLVMFGEYIPFSSALSWLKTIVPMPEDVTPGTELGIMEWKQQDITLGLMICFEDLMPYIGVELAEAGAQLFVNQTNDSWFDPYWGSRAHLANSVFRSVETRRPMLRGTNSGVSAWIDARGLVRQVMYDEIHESYRYAGTAPFQVEVPLEPVETPFQKHPRRFIMLCWLGMLMLWRPKGILHRASQGKAVEGEAP